ncbi:lysyl oxidase family protein [Phytohabitans sp. LJ34]|uniref:lysyl oxidase family protein n=1 Tax=Phytohabitans sp. LJ34 TaxID=3452217 RepID=UPI003F8C7C92
MATTKLLRPLAVGAVVLAMNGGAVAAAAPAPPPLSFVAATSAVTLERYPDEGVWLDLGTHVVAGKKPFEIRAKRASYADPIVATQGTGARATQLPAGLLTSFSGFSAFTHTRITDATGAVVLERDEEFCPNGYGARSRPDAPDTSPYPRDCATNPFTLGAVWGIQAGWSVPTSGAWWQKEPVDLPDGTYTATVTVNQPYRDLFGIPADQSSATVRVTVRSVDPGEPRRQSAAPADEHAHHTPDQHARFAAGNAGGQPAAARPAGKGKVVAGPKPDLRSLPAWGIEIGAYDAEEGHDYLSFNATVWLGGRSPLVVDGFRRSGQDIMDAYQYFYDAQGNQTGYAQVGTMEWDDRDGHNHWHFTDFAQYRLLDASQQLAVRSGKEAFCLANTDAVDLTLPRANWKPENTELNTSCGEQGSIAVREVLDIGNGDTYGQFLPGQSFDITDLPNGTYYVEVVANPDNKLIESDKTNNSSLRKVILGGEPGARTVEVPPHYGVVG